MESIFPVFFEKEIKLVVPIKSIITYKISIIGRIKAKITAKVISGSKTKMVFKVRQIWE